MFISTLLAIIGIASAIAILAAQIWIVVAAFRTSIVWGLVTLFVPTLGILLFAILHWQKVAKPLFLYLGGFAALGGIVVLTMIVNPGQVKSDKNIGKSESATIKTSAPELKHATIRGK